MTMRIVGHSAGLYFVQRQDTRDGEASFLVNAGGLVELGGWGQAGSAPEIVLNPPADERALHNVIVEDDAEGGTEALRRGVAELVGQHLERYAECRCWTGPGVDRVLVDWIEAGCVVEAEEEGDEEGDEVAEQPAEVAEPTGEPVTEEPAAEAEKVASAKKRAAAARKRVSTSS